MQREWALFEQLHGITRHSTLQDWVALLEKLPQHIHFAYLYFDLQSVDVHAAFRSIRYAQNGIMSIPVRVCVVSWNRCSENWESLRYVQENGKCGQSAKIQNRETHCDLTARADAEGVIAIPRQYLRFQTPTRWETIIPRARMRVHAIQTIYIDVYTDGSLDWWCFPEPLQIEPDGTLIYSKDWKPVQQIPNQPKQPSLKVSSMYPYAFAFAGILAGIASLCYMIS